ncbi:MAG: M56 family metallopeptidase [Fuerstiella sp.]
MSGVIFLAGQLGWGLVPFELNSHHPDLMARNATTSPSALPIAITPAEDSNTPLTNENQRSTSTEPNVGIPTESAPPAGPVLEYSYRPEVIEPARQLSDPSDMPRDSGVTESSLAETPQTTQIATFDNDATATVVLWNWQHWFVCGLIIVWIIGSFRMLLRLASGLLVVRRLRRSMTKTAETRLIGLFDRAVREVGSSKRLTLAESSIAPAPLSLGLSRPTVVLPTGLSETLTDEQLLSVLTHEVAHIARHDNRTSLVQQLAAVIFWWNPLLHAINRTANRLRERICDDYVVHALGHGRAFAEALVKVAEWCVYGPQPLSTGARKSQSRLSTATGESRLSIQLTLKCWGRRNFNCSLEKSSRWLTENAGWTPPVWRLGIITPKPTWG